MKLFRCHAVLPRDPKSGLYPVHTYVTIAKAWREARARVRGAEPNAEFVSVPCEAADPVRAAFNMLTGGELAALRAACEWNESQHPPE